MKRSVFYITWYTLALAGIVFALTIFVTIQRTRPLELAVLSAVAALQLIGLVYFLHHDPNKQESLILKCLLRLLHLSAIGVVFCLFVAIYGLGSQYHNPVSATVNSSGNENISIYENDELYVIYPEYKTLEFVTEVPPSRSDEDITFCCSATFQLRYNLFFTHDEISGVHVENGKLYKGYELNGLGAFTYYDGNFQFTNTEDAEDSLKRAAERGGNGFQGFMTIYNYEVMREPENRYRCFRILAEIDGKLCVIDSKKQMYLTDFHTAVIKLGVKNAMYLDTGNWSYSWYRDNSGKTHTLIGLPWPFAHNWITFRK